MREANQNFSSMATEVEAGERLVVERRGVPVLEIIPFTRKPARDREHEEAVESLMTLLHEGFDLGGLHIDRDEAHER